MKTFPLAAMGLAGALGLGGSARAEAPPTLSLGWVRRPGAESCVGPRALAEAVERRLGRAVFFSTAQAELSVEGQVEPDPSGGWRARIAIVDDRGENLGTRELQRRDPSCRALDDELALVIGLMIDPETAMGPLPPPIRPRPRPAPCPRPHPRRSPRGRQPLPPSRAPATTSAKPQAQARARARARPPSHGELGCWRAEASPPGSCPPPALGLHLRGVLEPPRGPAFELGGTIWSSGSTTAGSVGANVGLTEGILSVCPLSSGGATSGWIRMFGCAGARVGVLRVVASGLPGTPTTYERVTAAAAIEGRASLRPAGPLLVSFGTAIVVPLVRDEFFFTDATSSRRDVFRMSAVAGIVDLTLGVELP